MESSPETGMAAPVAAPPQPEKMVGVSLQLSHTEADRLRALGGSAWVRAQLAAASGGAGHSGAARQDAASDYLVGLARALFPLPVSGDAVRTVDVLRQQGMLEAAVTCDDAADGDGDRAIVVDITSLGRAEIERLRRIALSG